MIKENWDVINGEVIKQETELCDCCHRPNEHMIHEHCNDDMGGIRIGNASLHICPECMEKNSYVNDYGFTFIKAIDEYSSSQVLYVKHPCNWNYDKIRRNSQIEEAFNPEYYNFLRWKSR